MTASIIESYRRWRRYRRAYDALERLRPRELEDLGIPAGDIAIVARRIADA
jgi:uncharacterized protein YjiS (DUF1127 family)